MHSTLYKRFLLGINSAPEELQYALKTLLADIENTVNIVDNIIVFVKSDDDHDMGLNNFLKRLVENNIALNMKKCEFVKESIEYYGYVLSKDGMKPTPNVVHPIDV